MVTFVDITERKRAEDVLQRHSDDLEKLVEERTERLQRSLEEIQRLRHQLELENANLRQEVAEALEIGSYQLVKMLGKGGMGEVWVARHRLLARPAAIKLIRSDILDSEDPSSALRRFEREAQATATLQSHHTVEVYDFGVTSDGAFYYVMELLEGLDLQTLVERFGPIPAARVVFLLRQVCHSLGEAHDKDLIHRDIKPANIFLCHHGPDYDFVKVLDFGIVGLRGDSSNQRSDITVEGDFAGTPLFMAPEHARGQADIDGRVDIYSLGCVAYWLLTGKVVFEGNSPVDVIVQHVSSAPVAPSERTECEIPKAFEQIVLRCLEKDPADRPQSAWELDELLVRALSDDAWDTAQARDWWSHHHPELESRMPERQRLSDSATPVLLATKADLTSLKATLRNRNLPDTVPHEALDDDTVGPR